MNVWFDDSLPTLLEILLTWGGPAFVERGTVLRDATGRLSFYAAENNSVTDAAVEMLGRQIVDRRSRVCRGEGLAVASWSGTPECCYVGAPMKRVAVRSPHSRSPIPFLIGPCTSQNCPIEWAASPLTLLVADVESTFANSRGEASLVRSQRN